MRQQHKFLILIVIINLIYTNMTLANDWEEETQKHRAAQLTLITPIGSNGLNAAEYTNNFSLNIFFGISGGVQGFEIGGLHNTNKGDVSGFQIAGLGNLNTGMTKGVQFGGLYNIDLDLTTGVQVAGIANVIHGPSTGAQFAGISNFVSNESWAFQAGGIANIAPEGNHGLQIAGIANVNGKEGEGSQLAGITNVSYGETSVFQVAGLVNISTNRVDGAQIAGIANYTKKLNGFQLALINFADTVERGVPLGLISIVKHGYYAFEIEANDAFWINANYKMGVPKLYNIFTIGFTQQDSQEMWGVGLGLGSLFSIGKNWGLNLDLTATQINENTWWTEELNLLNKLKINAWFDLGKVQIYGGPALNVFVSQLQDAEGVPGGNLIDPGLSFYDNINGSTRTIIYPGFNIGLRF